MLVLHFSTTVRVFPFGRSWVVRTATALLASVVGASATGGVAIARTAESGNVREIILPEVIVTDRMPEGSAESGYRSDSGTLGPLGRTPLKDIPFSVNVTPGELIENSNAHTVGDALKTNPTATLLMSPGGYSSMSRMMVRGFTAADQSEMRDGLVDRSFSFPPVENVERIDVLNGFSGFLYGFSALGGTVNYISKEPTPDPLVSGTAGVYGGGIAFAHADLGGPVPGTGDRLGYRVNAYHEGGSTYIDDSNQERTLLSARFRFKAAENTQLWADIWHQSFDARGLQTYFNLGTGVAIPSASGFDATRQFGQSWTYNRAEKTVIGAGFDTRLDDAVSLRAGYRYGDMWRRYAYVGATLTDAAGTYTTRYTTTPRQNETTNSGYALLDVEGRTWGIGHTVTVGYTGTEYSYDRGNDVSVTLGTSSVGSPVAFANPARPVGGTNTWQSQRQNNLILGDRIALTDSLTALVGITHASLRQTAHGTGVAISTSNYTATANTPSLGLTFRPVPEVALYASYMEGLTGGESTGALTAVNRNQVLAPSVSKQYEVGSKATVGAIDLSAALFRIDKVNSEINPADNVFKQDGREIHQGLEVVATGKLTERLALVGGFTLMDAHIKNALANPAIEGRTPVNVPERQARLYLEYELPAIQNLFATGGVNYYGRRPVNVLNTDYISAATTFDAGLRYAPEVYGHKVTAALNVANLFDRATWAYYRNGDGLLLGQPRVVSLSLKARW